MDHLRIEEFMVLASASRSVHLNLWAGSEAASSRRVMVQPQRVSSGTARPLYTQHQRWGPPLCDRRQR